MSSAPLLSSATENRLRSTIYLGMDVHKDSITIAVLRDGSKVPERVERLSPDYLKLKRFLARLSEEGDLKCCYEASGAGYVLHRALKEWGYECEVIAPSLIPRRPGVQRKHDKYDASELARLYRSGDLTPVRIPTEAEERVRDLVRCRETLQRELHKSRHYLLKFLARRGLIFRDGKNWTKRHLEWLRRINSTSSPLVAEDQMIFSEYLSLFEYKLHRRDNLDKTIEALVLSPYLEASVSCLGGFRGVSTHSAMVLATEIVDWRRFDKPTQLFAYLGFVPREDSSGQSHRRGSITKAGNSHCRHALIQAAWSYRHKPALSVEIRRRQEGLPAELLALSWKAQHRLYKRFHHLSSRKSPQVAVVAVARELAGFLWSAMQRIPQQTTQTVNALAA